MKLNWETYKTLTKEQKKEYDFKFKDNPYIIDIKGLITPLTIISLIIMQFIFLLFIVVTSDQMEPYKEQVVESFSSIGQITTIILPIVLIFVLGGIIEASIRTVKYYKWKKKNKVKVISKWKWPWKKNDNTIQHR